MFVLTTYGRPGDGTRFECRFVGELVEERSSGTTPIGQRCSRMTLDAHGIEWEHGRTFDTLYGVEYIGITVNARHELEDYDGVFSLPDEAIRLLEAAGIVVGEDFK